MNLISCEECGVVLDKDRLFFPSNIWMEDGSVNTNLSEWDGQNFVPVLPCPVCEANIPDP